MNKIFKVFKSRLHRRDAVANESILDRKGPITAGSISTSDLNMSVKNILESNNADINKEQSPVAGDDIVKLVLGVQLSEKLQNNDPLIDWMKRARKYQQGNYYSLGDRLWDLIETEEMLEMKIGFALFGIPISSCENNTVLSYSDEQNKCIKSIMTHIITLHRNNIKPTPEAFSIYVACIFVHLNLKGKENVDGVDVLFRIPKTLDKEITDHLFIDANCRTYEGWQDYLNTNKLPKCYMCYPLNGMYSSKDDSVEIGFKESPACQISKSVFTGLDITSTVLTLGATGVTVASLAIPIAAPFVWSATATVLASGAYDIGRCLNRLIDIRKHHESLGLKNPESRGAWIGLAASTVGLVSIGGTALSRGLIKGEQVMSKGGAITLRVMNMSSVAINGVGVLNSLVTIVIKYLNGSIKKDDIVHFRRACYFFLNAVVSFEMADRLIKDIAVSDITNLFNSTKNCAFKFSKAAMEFTDSKAYNSLRVAVIGLCSRLMPNVDFYNVELLVTKVLILINDLSSGRVGWEKFVMEMSDILEQVWFSFKDVIIRSIEEICMLFKTRDWKSYITKSGYKPFLHSSPEIARQFCLTIHKTVAHCGLDDENIEYLFDIASLINHFNIVYPAKTSLDFLNGTKYICEYFKKQFDCVKESYELHLDSVKYNLKNEENASSFDDFNKKHNVEGNKNNYLFKKVLHEMNMERVLNDMQTSGYADSSVQSLRDVPCMETNISDHYVFSGPTGVKVLTEQQYWQKANEYVNINLNKDNCVMLSQAGIVLIKPNQQDSNIKAVVFYNTFEKNCVMGIVTVIKHDSSNINT